MMMRYFSLLLVLINYAAGATDLPDIYFKRINLEHGLSHRKVNCILQDKRGFIWFGTEDGLNRYDGRYLTYFRHRHNDRNTLSGNIISDLYEDNDGIIWIATQDGGMTRYDYRLPATKQFKQFRHDEHNVKGIPENGINKIVEDNYKCLWLGTSGSFAVRFNKKTEQFDTPVKKGTKCVFTLALGRHDTLLVGRAGGGLLKINTRTLSYRSDERYEDLYASLPHVSITSMFKDSKGGIWLGSWDKAVYRLSPDGPGERVIGADFQRAKIAKDDYISFAEDANGHIWMAGKETGIALYDPVKKTIVNLRHEEHEPGSLSDDHVNAVYKDRKGIMWIATNNGVNMINPLFLPFEQHVLPKGNKDILIYDFYRTLPGDLLVGTSNGIYIKEKHGGKLRHKRLSYLGQPLAITHFFMDIDRQFYIGTDLTLFRYDINTSTVSPLPNTDTDPVMKKLINSRIVSVIRDTLDHHPVLIVSPYGHYLTYYDLVEKKWISRADTVKQILKKYNIRDNLIRRLYKGKHHDIWLANFKNGLGNWKISSGNVKYYINDLDDRYSLSSNNVYDLREDFSGNLWISTYGGGINYFNRKKQRFYHLTESSNLSEGLQTDAEDNLWMICNGHIHKYDAAVRVYSCYDIPRLQNTGGLSGYLFKDDYGTIYAGGVNYFITFDPAAVAKIDHNPDIYFTDFKIFNTSYNEYLQRRTIKLDYTQDQITIEYAAPEYSGDNLQYSYKLDGYDREWILAGKRNYAEYANLKGGTYRFQVKATNWRGTSTEKVSVINIIIKPPFWLTGWFCAALFTLMTGIIYFVYRYRMNILLQQQAIRNGIAQDLHDQIGSTLSSISVYSEVARRYADHDQRTRMNEILDTISSTANEMILEMSDIVWAINPKNDNLISMLQRVTSYAEPLCRAKGINFIFKYDEAFSITNIGVQQRKNLFLILKEAINNAIKHSACKNLIVNLAQRSNFAELKISDDGKGFDMKKPEEGNYVMGNGVLNIRHRAHQLDAVIDYQSTPGAGTTISIVFKNK
jgi:signal transduction histidine kinase/ligand-binding sensor domain-containing protein